MDNEITALANMPDVSTMQVFDDKVFDEVSKSSDYLCRMQLEGSGSKLCKLDKIKKGNYAYILDKNEFKDLGQNIDAFIINWRPKALDMRGETPVSFFDIKSEGFKQTMALASQTGIACSYGPDFLVWLPSIKKFSTFLWGSWTARKDSVKTREFVGKPVTFGYRVAGPNKKQQYWETPTCMACSTPFDMWEDKVLQAAVSKFNAEATAKAPVPVAEPTRAR